MDNPKTIQELSDFIGRIVNRPLFPAPPQKRIENAHLPDPLVIVGVDGRGRKIKVTIEELQ